MHEICMSIECVFYPLTKHEKPAIDYRYLNIAWYSVFCTATLVLGANNDWVVVSNIFYLSPLSGEDFRFGEHIFQMTQVAAAAESRCSANDDKLDANGTGPNLQQALWFGYLVFWLFGFLVIWLFGYLVFWLFGFLVIWFSGYLVIWLFGFLAIWFFGYLVFWLFGYLVIWLFGYLVSSYLVIWFFGYLFFWLFGFLVIWLIGFLVIYWL